MRALPSSTRPGFPLSTSSLPIEERDSSILPMPADSPPPYTPTPTTPLTKSKSSPLLQTRLSQTSYPLPQRRSTHVAMESEADDWLSEDEAIYALSPSSRNFKPVVPGSRSNVFGTRSSSSAYDRPRMICTARGAQCAGETETELDEPVRLSTHILTLHVIPHLHLALQAETSTDVTHCPQFQPFDSPQYPATTTDTLSL